MKKKLLITVGAGASIDFGLPSVRDVDSIFDTCAGRLFPLRSDPTSNLYRYFRDAIETYYGTASKSALRKWVNFEEVLYQLNLDFTRFRRQISASSSQLFECQRAQLV